MSFFGTQPRFTHVPPTISFSMMATFAPWLAARRRWGRGFTYQTVAGQTVRCRKIRAWITSLAIPPQWTDVEIAAVNAPKILATGRDAAGRKQYIYNPAFREAREAEKYHQLVDFGAKLPTIRRCYRADFHTKDATRHKALILALLDQGAMRVGSRVYLKENGYHGAITLKPSHLSVRDRSVIFEYRAKGGKPRIVKIEDSYVIDCLKSIQTGRSKRQSLFRAGKRPMRATVVRTYLERIVKDVRPKDFRTWHGSVAAFKGLRDASQNACGGVKTVLEYASKRLGNRPAICRSSYVHPNIIEAAKAGCAYAELCFPGPAKTGLTKLESDFLNWLEKR